MANRHRHRRSLKADVQRRAPPGTPPGTLIVDPKALPTTLRVVVYSSIQYEAHDNVPPAGAREFVAPGRIAWIDVEGLGTSDALQALARAFGIHPLALEDIGTTHQRAKVEEFPDNVFIVARMPVSPTSTETDQISMLLGEGWLLTFCERHGEDCMDPVRQRLEHGRGRARNFGADYLAYALLDSIVDGYFPVLEQIGDTLEALEDRILLNPGPECVSEIHHARREMLALRRSIWPMREALATLMRDENRFVTPDTRTFLRDCHDHTVQLIELLENYREITAAMMDIYLSSVSNRMNEIMKVLTIISTIFIPLSVVVGLYGMNFDTSLPGNMPELKVPYGYVGVLLFMAALGGLQIWYFHRRGWLKGTGIGKGKKEEEELKGEE